MDAIAKKNQGKGKHMKLHLNNIAFLKYRRNVTAGYTFIHLALLKKKEMRRCLFSILEFSPNKRWALRCFREGSNQR